MAAKKYYAVKKGRETGIFHNWGACKAVVEGYCGAEYKGFVRLDDAEAYLGGKAGRRGEPEGTERAREKPAGRKELPAGAEAEPARALPEDCPAEGVLLAYVDGSYDHSLRKYAFGCVFILPDGRIKFRYGNGDNARSLQQRNVAGEMLGAMYAVKTAMVSGFSKIEIRYDYEGIEKWVTGAWRSKTELTQKYADAMRQWGENITICFTKVAAHSNVYYNEMADRTAKAGLREGEGIPKVCHVEELKDFCESIV